METPVGKVSSDCKCEDVNGTWFKGGPGVIPEDCTMDGFTLNGKPCRYTFVVNGDDVGPVATVKKGDSVGVRVIPND